MLGERIGGDVHSTGVIVQRKASIGSSSEAVCSLPTLGNYEMHGQNK